MTGTTSIPDLGRVLAEGEPSAFAGVSVVLLLVGFGFKVAAVPFHAWTPDAYEGAPTPVGALMAAGVKTAAVVTFARVFVTAFTGNGAELLSLSWPRLIEILAALTIVYGNHQGQEEALFSGEVLTQWRRQIKEQVLDYGDDFHA